MNDFLSTLGDVAKSYFGADAASAQAKAAQAAAAQKTAATANPGGNLSQYLPWLIGGGVLLVVAVIAFRKS